jgi:hypothetical protein
MISTVAFMALSRILVVRVCTQEAKMHRYAFDGKFFASVTISARNVKTARKILQEVVDTAELEISAVQRKNQRKIVDASLFLDDERFPFLAEYDGLDPDDDEVDLV